MNTNRNACRDSKISLPETLLTWNDIVFAEFSSEWLKQKRASKLNQCKADEDEQIQIKQDKIQATIDKIKGLEIKANKANIGATKTLDEIRILAQKCIVLVTAFRDMRWGPQDQFTVYTCTKYERSQKNYIHDIENYSKTFGDKLAKLCKRKSESFVWEAEEEGGYLDLDLDLSESDGNERDVVWNKKMHDNIQFTKVDHRLIMQKQNSGNDAYDIHSLNPRKSETKPDLKNQDSGTKPGLNNDNSNGSPLPIGLTNHDSTHLARKEYHNNYYGRRNSYGDYDKLLQREEMRDILHSLRKGRTNKRHS